MWCLASHCLAWWPARLGSHFIYSRIPPWSPFLTLFPAEVGPLPLVLRAPLCHTSHCTTGFASLFLTDTNLSSSYPQHRAQWLICLLKMLLFLSHFFSWFQTICKYREIICNSYILYWASKCIIPRTIYLTNVMFLLISILFRNVLKNSFVFIIALFIIIYIIGPVYFFFFFLYLQYT